MNIQVFGKAKCFETRKAERYFSERRIRYQMIDIIKYGLSKGEYESVKKAVGSMEDLLDGNSKEEDAVFLKYMTDEAAKEEKLLNNPKLFKTPIVRNGKKATVGYHPEIWKTWE
ncbi:MAG: ArsC family transcriptional regulator [Clostridia bacterium]|nr:ArsC family transcriptional regulator [Clostridia bacterium]MDD4572019.1 ArsC family transcriptional regulator [Clostridia bacterium]